jgi:hypothetical protein
MVRDTKLADITDAARTRSSNLNGVKFECRRAETLLVFRVDCWISGIVIRQALEQQGWKVEEKGM